MTVERYAGRDAENEDRYDDPVAVTGFYRDGTTITLTPAGDEQAAAGRFAYPASVPTIPVLSRLTLPATFGGDVVYVMTSVVGDGGGNPTPDHKIVEVR